MNQTNGSDRTGRPAADARGSDPPPGVVGWFLERQRQQPSLAAEVRAMVRGTREELFNNLIVAFPHAPQLTREQGAPGSPTPQITTEDLMGKAVHQPTDTLAGPAAPEPSPAHEQQRTRGR